MLDLLPWLLHGSTRPEYAAKQAEAADAWVALQGIPLTLCCLLAIIAARLAFNALFAGTASRLAAARGQTPAHRDGRKLLEEAWVLCGNVSMLAMAGYVMARRNGGCSFASLRPCLEGWPSHPIDAAATLYYALELAWYAHLLLKPVLGYGLGDGRDMQLHHAVSVAMLVFSLGLNLSRMGVVVLALFGISNPVLHAAKIANQLHVPGRMVGFAAFAAAFGATRVVAVPAVILVPTGLRAREWIPYAVADFHAAYLILNVLLWVLYGMQLVWMAAILRVLRQAATKGADAASEMSARVDPAKRYAPEAAAPTPEANGNGVAREKAG